MGLQCVAFNQEVYRSIIEWGVRWGESKWRAAALASGPAPGGGKTAVTPGRRNQSLSQGGAVAVASPSPGSNSQLGPGSTMFNVASALAASGESPTRGRENMVVGGKR